MKFIIPTTLSLSILFVFSNFTNQKTDETPCLGCQRRENLRKSLPALPTLKNIHYYDSQTQNVKDEYVTIEQIFQKNSAELAILIYDAQTKKYYVYDEQLEALAKTKDDLYFIIIENDRIPHHYGPTKKTNPSLILDALKGDSHLQYRLGLLYLNGRNGKYYDFEQDYANAFKWLLKSAQQDCEPAYSPISRCYHYGWGVSKNDIEAFKWLEKLYKSAYFFTTTKDVINIAHSYEYGIGVSQDMEKALSIYRDLAVNNNNALAMYKIGLCYTFGKGVKQDHDEAIKWFHKAIQEDTHDFDGSFGAYIMLGYYFQEGLTGKEPDRKAAIEWYEKAIAEGAPQTRELPPAVANNLAVLYLKDDADEIDS
ncbi:MAG TPA: tetratricopeptide repeat protein, partial [Candidatus Babeliales bacterium]|nr:tetratricopeptide repeat protein [Candidatus Babeliales bacterium]